VSAAGGGAEGVRRADVSLQVARVRERLVARLADVRLMRPRRRRRRLLML